MNKKTLYALLFGFILGWTRSLLMALVITGITFIVQTVGFKAWKRIQLGKMVEEREG